MSKVIINGVELDMDTVSMYMDEELREELHNAHDWKCEQEFLDAYMAEHEARFGEVFEV